MGRKAKLSLALALAVVAGLVIWKRTGGQAGSSDTADNPTPAQVSRAGKRTATLVPLAHMPEQQMLYEDDPAGDQRLEGQVVDSQERPVGDVTVVIDSNPRREVRTEADGSFVFDGLVSRAYRIEARKGAELAGPVRAHVSAELEPVVLRLRTAGSLEITVVEAESERPIEGALVELRGLGIVSATTDAQGIAAIHGVGTGTQTVKVSATGFASRFELVTSAGAAGDVVRRRYALQTGIDVSGTVVDTAGQPIEGASVLVENISFLGALSDPRLDGMVTDAKGRWRFAALPRATVRFRATHPRFAPTVSAPVPLADGVGRTGVEIALDAGARLTGRVVDANGVATSSAVVHVGGASVASALVRHAHCDAEGRFELLGLPRTSLHLVAMSESASSELVPVDMTSKRERTVVVTLDGSDGIAGVVVDSAGEPVPEARVVARPDIAAQTTATSELRLRGAASVVADGDGAFSIPGLRSGRYRLRAIRPGTPSNVLDMRQGMLVDSNATGVRVAVDDLTSARGVVRFASGGHPQRFSVSLGRGPGQSFIGTDGAFALSDVPAGKQFLTVIGPELVTTYVEELEVTGHDDNDLGTITVARGRTIRGRVLDSAGAPVAGATIDAGEQLQGDARQIATFWEETDGTKRVVSGSDGRYQIAGLGPTPIVLVADHDVHGRSRAVGLPASAQDVAMDLRLERTGSMQGRISVNGKPASGIMGMRPKGGSDLQLTARTGPDGAYHFDRLAPGEYVAYCWFERGSETSGGAGRTIPVTIVSGETKTVDVDFPLGELTVTLRLHSEGDVVQFGYGVLVGTDMFPEPRTLTITEARATMASLDPETSMVEGVIVEDRRIVFSGLMPGQYVACASPLSGDPRDPEALGEHEKNTVEQIMYCQPTTLTSAPLEQEVVVTVKPAP